MTQSIEDYEKLRIPSVITLLTGRLDGFVVGSSQWREDKEVKGEPVDDTDAEEEQIFLNAIRAMYASDEDEEVARLRFEESQGGPGREPLSSRRYPIRLKRKQPSSGSSHRAAKDDGTPLERRRNSAKRTRIDGQYTGSSVVANSLNSGRTTGTYTFFSWLSPILTTSSWSPFVPSCCQRRPRWPYEFTCIRFEGQSGRIVI